MQVTGCLSRSFTREGIDEIRRRKYLSCSKFIGRCKRTDSSQDRQAARLVLLEGEPEIAAPGEGAGYDISGVFLQPVRIEAYQEGRIRALGHLRAAAGFNHLCIMLQDFPVHLHLIGPTTVEMGQIILVRIQVQGAGSIVEQLHGFLAGVPDFRMGTDDVLFLVGVIDKPHFQEGNRILQEDLRCDDVPVRDNLMIRIDQFRIVVSIGILHMEGGFAEIAAARRGIAHGSFSVVRPPTCPEGGEGRWIGDLSAEMDRLQDAVLLRDEDELRVFRLHRDDGFPGRRGRNGQGDSQQA